MPTSVRVSFLGHDGLLLDGRLELPDAKPLCYATFSHCFTCNKDSLAAYRISKALARKGIATLRFDFAGLGGSEGDFADTSFSTARQDLLAAASYLEQGHQGPAILIGHSMGGTTALSCAGDIDSVSSVVTIAAPSQPAHVLHHFGPALDELKHGRISSISVAGQRFTIKPDFIDDLQQHDMRDALAAMDRHTLIFNVIGDNLVDEHNATEIEAWVQGDTTLIDLEDTDHVISDKRTAERIAANIEEHHRFSA